ncbi:MAG: hypothetical protein HY286_12390 [Planctomycetes bacterium]|nr:hypothetical protein [Planctomycetota bacterium]
MACVSHQGDAPKDSIAPSGLSKSGAGAKSETTVAAAGVMPVLAARQVDTKDHLIDCDPSTPAPFEKQGAATNNSSNANSKPNAIELAREWIKGRLGSTYLELDLKVRETRKLENPEYLAFGQYYEGIKVRRAGAEVKFDLGIPKRGNLILYKLAEVPDSKRKVIEPADATESWCRFAAMQGTTIKDFAEKHDIKITGPVLIYSELLHETRREIAGNVYTSTFNPTWALDADLDMCVNAHTGKAWFRYEDQ